MQAVGEKIKAEVSDARTEQPAGLAGLAFFDVFAWPLTLVEQWRWQYGWPGKSTPLRGCLADPPAVIDEAFGLRSLTAGQASRTRRWQRYRLAERKFRRARWFAWWASRLPTVRLVAVGNSLAWSSAADDSDIDLFVVTRPGTLWATRLLLGAPLKLLGLRPTPNQQRDRLCLSFMVSEAQLDLAGLRLGSEDVYFAFWLAALVPLYDADQVMRRLWQANRRILNRLPAAFPRRVAERRQVKAGRWPRSIAAEALVALSRTAERPSRWLQERLFPSRIRELANRDSRVVITDHVLKFHVDDRRQLFREGYEKRIQELSKV
jgi:hypothetical protein